MTPPSALPLPAVVPPLEADAASVAACGERLLVASATLDRQATEPDPVPAAWTGLAAAAQASAARRLRHRAQALALAQRHLAIGLLVHAAALEGLGEERERLVAWGAVLGATRAALHRVLGAAAPDPVVEARAAGLVEELRRHAGAVAAWSGRVADAEAAVLAACRAAGGGAGDGTDGTDGTGRAWAGAPDPGDAALASLLGVLTAAALAGTGPDGAVRVARWWARLDDAARWAVLVAAPGVVGVLDGLPARVRDRANRLAVALDLAGLGARSAAGVLGRADGAWLRHAQAAEAALGRAESRHDPRSGTPVVATLWDYAPVAHGGDGTVALAHGDPDAAAHVAVLVPGLGADADAVVEEADDAWHLFAAARATTADTVATVAWIGYDAPSAWASGDLDAWRVADEGLARAGGAELARDLDGLLVARADDPHLTVVGHSYGSTTVAQAAAGPGLPADDLVLLGSPGAGPAGHAEDLGVEDRVWVGSASSDPVTRLGDEGWLGGVGTLGEDPAGEAFGARRFRAEDAAREVGLPWSPDQHSGYLEPGGESLAAVALVVGGRPDDVVAAAPRRDPWWGPVRDPEAGRPLTGGGATGRP